MERSTFQRFKNYLGVRIESFVCTNHYSVPSIQYNDLKVEVQVVKSKYLGFKNVGFRRFSISKDFRDDIPMC